MDKKKTDFSLEEIIKTFPVHVYCVDKDGNVLGCNELQAKDLGFASAKELIGKNLSKVFKPTPLKKLLETNQRVMQSNKILFLEEAFTFKGKKYRYLSCKSPWLSHDGKVSGVFGISFDLANEDLVQSRLTRDLKKAQSAAQILKETEEQSRSLLAELGKKVTGGEFAKGDSVIKQVISIKDFLENIIAVMPGNVYWLDKNNVYLGCNNNNAVDAGLKSRHEIIGKTNHDLAWIDNADFIESVNNQVMRSGKEIEVEDIGMSVDGLKTYITKKVPLRDENNKVIGLVGISIDITDKKRMQVELEKAKEKAESASAAKTEFILNMEHDIRTPIAHIISLTDILAQKNQLSEEQEQEYLKHINNSSKKLLDLVGEILTFADIEQGNVPCENSYINLRKIIDDVIALEKPALVNKKLDTVVDYPELVPLFFSDRTRLHRILLNLVSNAIKYTEKGRIKIRVKVDQIGGRKDKANLILSVEDSGIGIPKDKQETIFERFTKLMPSNKNRVKGLGLGLWIVRQFVTDLDGEVVLKSKLHKGSTFTITIPVRLGES